MPHLQGLTLGGAGDVEILITDHSISRDSSPYRSTYFVTRLTVHTFQNRKSTYVR